MIKLSQSVIWPMNCLKRSPYWVGFTLEMVFFLWNRDLKMVSMPFFVSYCCRMSMMPGREGEKRVAREGRTQCGGQHTS